MIGSSASDSEPAPVPPAPPAPQAKSPNFWFKYIIATNPFYLVSAAMMLLGIHQVSVDTELIQLEMSKLQFNFSSLQLYELMLAITAIFLAGRKIWYDSALLVSLDNLFAFVPFILISQAVTLSEGDLAATPLLENRAMMLLCFGTVVFLGLRFWLLNRHLEGFHIPRWILVGGLALTSLNILLPITFRYAIEGDAAGWTHASPWVWLVVLPTILAIVGFTTSLSRRGPLPLQSGWMPLLFFGFWFAATAVHLRTLDYFDDAPFTPYQLSGIVWVLGWLICLRIREFAPGIPEKVRVSLTALPLLAPVLALEHTESACTFALALVNTVIFAALSFRKSRDLDFARLTLLSLSVAWAGLPPGLVEVLLPEYSLVIMLRLTVLLAAILLCLTSRDPHAGVAGAVFFGMATAIYIQHLDYLGPYALQNGLIFLLVHSLFWKDSPTNFGRALRFAGGIAFAVHSAVWSHIVNFRVVDIHVGFTIFLAGLLLLAAWLLAWKRTGQRPDWTLPLFASAGIASVPVNFVFDLVRVAPVGYLTILGSFAVFGLGTLSALFRQKLTGTNTNSGGATAVLSATSGKPAAGS